MPSAKPDPKEIRALEQKRRFEQSRIFQNLFADLHSQCISAVAEGYTTLDRASVLLDYLKKNPRIAAIYPNNILTHLLQNACVDGGWSDECEHDILSLTYSLYLGYEALTHRQVGLTITSQIDEKGIGLSVEPASSVPQPPSYLSFAIQQLKIQTPWLREALLSDHVDSLDRAPDLKDQFVGFTGEFQYGSRAKCFEEARKRGAVPRDPSPFMDYLFISTDFEKRGIISSKLDTAILYRRVYGYPLILSEQVWNDIVQDLQ